MSEKNSAPPDSPKNRYYPRLNAEILLAYRPPGARQDESRVVKSKSMGLGGIMFESDHPLPVGSSFLLDLVLGDEHLEVSAKVVYSNRMRNDSYQNGFNFVDLSENQREQLTNFFLQEYDRASPDGP
jgi:c-di-GMP-binding flagellar brake protein YcgR